MKMLLLGVTCQNPFASDTPSVFYWKMEDAMKDLICRLHQEVIRLQVARLSHYVLGGHWSHAPVGALGQTPPGTPEEFMALEPRLESKMAQVESCMLQITPTGFYFTATPRFGGDTVELRTERVPIDALGSNEVWVRI